MPALTKDEKHKCIELMHRKIEDLSTQNGSVEIHGQSIYTTGLLATGVATSEGLRELSKAIQLTGRESASSASGQ